jgi:hypothetical protein
VIISIEAIRASISDQDPQQRISKAESGQPLASG